jgi:hypothetical protein
MDLHFLLQGWLYLSEGKVVNSWLVCSVARYSLFDHFYLYTCRQKCRLHFSDDSAHTIDFIIPAFVTSLLAIK